MKYLIILSILLTLVYAKNIDISNTLVKRSSTCDPNDFTIDRDYNLQVRTLTINGPGIPNGWKYEDRNLYNCVILSANTIIACKVNMINHPDAYVAFKVRVSKTNGCTKSFCQEPRKSEHTYLYDNNNRLAKSISWNEPNKFHFCHHYTYTKNNVFKYCDVNYQIIKMEYEEYPLIKDILEWALNIFKK